MLAGPDLLVILVIALIVFGGNRVADLGAGLGREFETSRKVWKVRRPLKRN